MGLFTFWCLKMDENPSEGFDKDLPGANQNSRRLARRANNMDVVSSPVRSAKYLKEFLIWDSFFCLNFGKFFGLYLVCN